MRKAITILFALLTCISASSQDFIGSWTGKLDVMGTQLNLVFNITKADGGSLACTMDSPDQNVKGIPAEITVADSGKMKIDIAPIMASFEGKQDGNMIKGTFNQGGMSFPLELRPGTVERNRPQTPQEPYPYKTEEVRFENKADNASLCGTLTYPVNYGKADKDAVPIVVMVTGSGLQNRDEEIFDHKTFLVIAYYFARNGIATLRYDDRVVGKSTGDAANATTVDFMNDALAAVGFARNTGKFGPVGVLGHSEGGSIAFMLGAQGKADFIVSMAGPGVSGADILVAQNKVALKTGALPDNIVNDYCAVLRIVLAELASSRAVTDPESAVHSAVSQAGVSLPAPLTANLVQVIRACTPWLRYFIAYDPAGDIKAVKCPTMAVNGESDTQVAAKANIGAIRTLLPDNPENLVKTYPGLNHLFQTCITGLAVEYGQIDETISPAVLKDMADWINAVSAAKLKNQ